MPLKILHVLRAPVGGLFRHVIDLARGQAARGHAVGIIADAATGGGRAEQTFASLAPSLALGLSRVAMSRHIGTSDLGARQHVARRAAEAGADVVHGHGAKGGAYARLVPRGHAIRVYTPHGGSLHYGRGSPVGLLYLTLERAMLARTDLFLFESNFGRDAFHRKIGAPRGRARVVHNGVTEAEFADVAPAAEATDFVFIGELRALKGVDVLIEAAALLARQGKPATGTIIGDGPDADTFRAQTQRLGLEASVRFAGPMPARAGFALGRCLVVPSRAESLPYIVLEAAAAAVPMITTTVGGIPEIFGPMASLLIPPGDPAALAGALAAMRENPDDARKHALTLRARVRNAFSVERMTDQVLAAYVEALDGVRRA